MNINLKNIILLISFVVLQIVWFNHILIFGKYTPIIFLYPILMLPLHKNETIYLLLSFFLGLIIDFFLFTGGVFAFTAIFVYYFRKAFFIFTKENAVDIKNIQPSKLDFVQKYIYFFVFIMLAELLIYTLNAFNIELVVNKIGFILANSMISLFFFIFIDLIFFNNKEQ